MKPVPHPDFPANTAFYSRRCPLALAVSTVLALSGQSLPAATINVSGACTLPDAVTAAETDTATGSCTAGAGNDTINLDGSTITLTTGIAAGFYGSSGTPLIQSNITIEGNGSTIQRSSMTDFRLFTVESGNLTLNEVTLTNGSTSAGYYGGAIYATSSTLTITNTTITGNTTTGDGGAIFDAGPSNITITNSTISGNTASGPTGGGGIYVNSGTTLTLINATVTGNATGGATPGGGIFADPGATVNLTRSIVYGNTGANECSSIDTTTSSVDSDNSCGATMGNPMLGALADNGGPTFTHAITAMASAAVDVGGNCGLTDQRGATRDATCDAGAFEYGASLTTAAPTVTSPASATTVNAANFTITGTAEADATVRIYSDANNNGSIDGADAVVSSQVLTGGATSFSISTALTQNAANNFLVTADVGGAESTPTDVPTITEDSIAPTVTVDIVDPSLSDSDNSSTVTFEFSETVSGFVVGDLTVAGGSISSFSMVDGDSYPATFTATDNSTTAGSVTVDANSYTDAAGNTGASGNDTVTVDTVNPTVTVDIVDTSLSDSDNSSTVTFEFSETVAGFAAGDLTVAGGSISGFSMVDGDSYTATFTATDNSTTAGSVTVDANSYTDAAGNTGASGNDTVTVDTVNPTVTVEQAAGQADPEPTGTTPINFTATFSEAITGFMTGDVTVGGTAGATTGTVTEIAPMDGTTFNIAVSGMTGAGTVTASLAASVATDAAGNNSAASTSTDNSVTLADTGVTVSAPTAAAEGGATSTYTVTLDAPPTSGNVDISVTSADPTQCTVLPVSLTLNAGNLGDPVTVTAVDDGDIEGDHTCIINHAITATGDAVNYPTSLAIASANVMVTDNDDGVVIQPTAGSTMVTEGGATDTFDVFLTTAATVDVTLTPDAQTDLGSGVGTAHVLNFTAGNTPQTVTVTAADDAVVEGSHTSTIMLTSTSGTGAYNPATFVIDGDNGTPVTTYDVQITDNDASAPANRTLDVSITGMGSVTSSPTGIDCPTDCTNSYSSGTLVTLTATPDAGWQFDSWGDNCANSPSDTSADIVMTANRLCSITFTEVPADPGIVSFTQSSYTVDENDGSITINVSRTGQADGAASVDFALSADTASASSDYTDTGGTLNWADGETGNKTFDIAVLDDSNVEGNESLTLSLGNPNPTDLGLATDTATLTIIDDDTAPTAQPGQAQFVDVMGQIGTIIDGTLLITVPEDIGDLLVNVSRTNGSDGAVSIDFSVIPAMANMATLVEDFLLMDDTLNWADGNTDDQSFMLTIVDDLVEETSLESFFVELDNPTNGLVTGSPATLGITIVDNDACDVGVKGLAFDANSNLTPTTTCFVDLLDDSEQQGPFTLDDIDSHRTEIRIDVGEEHQGQAADILLLGGYRFSELADFDYYHRPGGIWTPNPIGMLPAAIESVLTLPANVSVLIHDGPLTGLPGNFEFYVGYLLEDGTLVYNGNSVQSWIVE